MKYILVSFQAKLFGCFLAVAALAIMVPIFYARPVLHDAMLQASMERLQQETRLLNAILGPDPEDAALSALSANLAQTELRLSLVDPQGKIVFESSPGAGEIQENHADRPEIQEAMASGQGTSTRFSTTLRSELLYAALRLESGSVLRLAVPFTGVDQRIEAQLTGLSLAAVIAIGLSLVLAWFFSRRIRLSLAGMIRIVEGISGGRFSRRLHILPGLEFQPLADAVHRMAESMENSLRTIEDQKNQLEAVLETMAEGVLVLSPTGRIRRVNKRLAVCIASPHPAEGRQVMDVLPSSALEEAVSTLLDDPEGYGKSIHLQIPLNKSVFSVLLARPVKGTAASIGLVAVFHDISELVRLEAVRRDFVANVSHELRTPLTAIQGYAETLEGMDEIPEQGRRFAGIICKRSRSLAELVDELLTLSRLESDRFCLNPAPINAADAVRRAAALLRSPDADGAVAIVEDVPQDLLVLADAALIERVFRNLLENARRYTPEGSEIRVSVRRDEKNAVFAVSDQGPGIPAPEQERIFERFYQVEKHRTTSQGGGSGLGLAICKHIIERHHGRIWVESPSVTPAAATTFFFTVPLAVAGHNGEQA